MDNFTFQVDLKGIIRLLSDNLYSDDRVFLRELLQNAIDAISARKLEQPDFDGGCVEAVLEQQEEQIYLTFFDNGIGLTKEEIHEFLSVIGKSSKRESELRSSFIGQFGIGLLSCFLVADTIEVHTRSVKSEVGYVWMGKSDGAYSIEEDPDCKEQGTAVRLLLTSNMRQKYDYETVCEALAEYGFLVRIPIRVTQGIETARVNDNWIPWRESFYTTGDALEFGEKVFGRKFFDVVTIREADLTGFVYITSEAAGGRTLLPQKVYLKDMFITEDGKELIPPWAFFTQSILNADNLTPTASREGFYRDGKLLKARAAIERGLIEYFTAMAQVEPQKLTLFTQIHNVAIKALAVENDRVFKIFFPHLNFQSSKGTITGSQLIATSKQQPVYYCSEVDAYRKLKPIVESGNFLLINAGYIYDATLVGKANRAYKNLRLSLLTDEEVGRVLAQLPPEETSGYQTFLDLANEKLRGVGCVAEMRRFSPPELSGLFIPGTNGLLSAPPEEEMEEDDTLSFLMEGFGNELSDLGYSHLYLNAGNKMVQQLSAIKDAEMAQTFGEVLYLQALMLGSYPLGNNELKLLNRNLNRLIQYGLFGLEETR